MRGKECLAGYTGVDGCANNASPETAEIPATCFNLQNSGGAEGSFSLAADSQLRIQTHFSLVSSMGCASFPLKASDSHFQIRPSVIFVFQHYRYSHSKTCKCELESKKCSNSCKKCCKC